MTDRRPPENLSLTEWAVLGVLAEAPAHPFAIARHLGADGTLGRVLTVRRPLVYRALDRLVESGLAAPVRSEPGEAGPRRTVHRVTTVGVSSLDQWLAEPVHHIRELRLAFLLKAALLQRAGRPVDQLVRLQRTALADRFAALASTTEEGDLVDRWRRHQAAGARAFLDELAG